MLGGEISIQAFRHPNRLGRWITIPIIVAGSHRLSMVVDSGAPASAIRPEVADALARLELLQRATDPQYHHRLTSLSVSGQPLSDLEVRVLPRLTRLQVAGLLGLDFLNQFVEIRFHVPTFRLVLVRS